MAYKICQNIDECRDQLKILVDAFGDRYADYKKSAYSEAQVRIDFLNPLLKCFGWDVDNEARKTQLYREVIQEESIELTLSSVMGAGHKYEPIFVFRKGE